MAPHSARAQGACGRTEVGSGGNRLFAGDCTSSRWSKCTVRAEQR